MRARVFGAHQATGQVLLFLDSHCEVNKDWLRPLLEPIYLNHKLITVPMIDIINHNTFEYSSSPLVKGGFNWGLHFKWDSISKNALTTKEDFIKPIPLVYFVLIFP